ncbi:MAG: DNA gyrase subunit A [Candidatus Jorgensenbacteria bacterium]|nr:DNA gyrase subunit A [Candidatus Jorgensenbacteria bacterium]
MKKKKEEPIGEIVVQRIEPREITDELKSCYLDYAMSVIVSRALPDVRDGLKPVQRRILWAMWDTGLLHSAKFRKSANVVGEVLGKYHPHGDSAVYDAMARMAQDFSLRYPLVDGQGNWGSIDGDAPAAMRYTEARLTKIAAELLVDIEKGTVDWNPNYDNSREEPTFFPAKLPHLLLNGTVGIAVGMATSIPPHNLMEIVDATIYLSNNPDANTRELLQFVPGPDFPTGGIIYDKRGIEEAYSTGRGAITMRAVTEIEERKAGSFHIIVSEIPYQVNKSDLITKMAELAQEKRIEGIRDLRDESDREDKVRIVIDLKNDASPQKVLNQLFEYTELQKNFHFNMLALVNGIQPQILSLKDVLSEYIAHRKVMVRRRTEFDLKKAEDRAHILIGLVTALDVIDKIIATIKKSKDKEAARENLMKNFKLSEIQANAILEMKLAALAALERIKLEDELKEKKKFIAECQAILKSAKRMLEIIQSELQELKETYSSPRRTRVIASGLKEFREEDLVPQEEVIITMSQDGYIKRMSAGIFKAQKRGGKGLIGSELKDEDLVNQIITADTHDNILFFTDHGRVFQTKAYEVPVAARTAKGKSVHNFLTIPPSEKICSIVSYSDKQEKNSVNKFLVMATQGGVIKKTPVTDFANVRRSGIIALKLKADDSLQWAAFSGGEDEIILVTSNGQSIRFKEKDVRAMGRTAAGTKAARLKKGDVVAGFDIIPKGTSNDTQFLVVMAHGFAKQTPLKDYKTQKRGGGGIKTAKITEKTGKVIAARIISDEVEEVLAFSSKGQALRTKLADIRVAGRATQGVKIMNLDSGDSLMGIVCL